MTEQISAARTNLSETEFEYSKVVDELRAAQRMYNEALIDECVEELFKLQKEYGELTKRDLKIFIRDLATKLSDIKSK
jgi:hypothetical protein